MSGRNWEQEGAQALRAARAHIEERTNTLRAGTRGLLLPMFTWPLVPDAMIEVAQGDARGFVAAALGLGLPLLAVRHLRSGRAGGTQRAAVLTGVATGLVAGLGAATGPLIAVALGFGAWFGARLLYDGAVVEVEPPAPPAPPPPPGPMEEARARLARIGAEPRLVGAAGALAGVLDDLALRPERLTEARRFLNVHLDGLERIADRLQAGAAPPPGLPVLLDDLQKAADELRDKLRAEETAALDIQVKVLAERLRQEGY